VSPIDLFPTDKIKPPIFPFVQRAVVDRLLGGSGMGDRRRDPDHLLVGDKLDFWRVLEFCVASG